MSLRLRIACAVLWLFCSSVLPAQVGLSIPQINNAAPNTFVNFPVSVTNFDSIVSMQFVIRWNPTVLKYLAIDKFDVVPGLSITNFNVQNALDSGYVRLQWEGPNSFPGVTVPDTSIFRLRFRVLGQDTSSSSISFTEIVNSFPATNFEIVKVISPDSTLAALTMNDCNLQNGFIAVGFTVSSREPRNADALHLNVFPNPISGISKATFFLEQKADVQVLITDAIGRTILQKDMPQLPSGTHGFDIDSASLPTKGAYFLTIRAGSSYAVRSMLYN